MSGWIVVRGNIAASQVDSGDWVAEQSLSAPVGKFVVSGSYRYDNSGYQNPSSR